MAEHDGEKEHEATPHRREKAREQGQVPKSQDLASAAITVGALASLIYFGQGTADYLGEIFQAALGGEAWLQADVGFIVLLCRHLTLGVAGAVLPLLGVLFVIGVASNLAQVGFMWTPERIQLDFSHVNPLSGFGRILSLNNAIRTAFGICKITIGAAVAVWCIASDWGKILSLGGEETSVVVATIISLVLWTSLKVAVAMLLLAALDYMYQRWKFEQDLRMTTQEMKEEMKEMQGDPQMVARRRAVQRQMVMNMLSNAVPRADAVITNPTELAIAIKYDYETMPAPVVVAKGAGVLAQRIRRLALENGVPIVERKELARSLYQEVDVNQQVPEVRFAAVAEVLRYVYQLQGRTIPGTQSTRR